MMVVCDRGHRYGIINASAYSKEEGSQPRVRWLWQRTPKNSLLSLESSGGLSAGLLVAVGGVRRASLGVSPLIDGFLPLGGIFVR